MTMQQSNVHATAQSADAYLDKPYHFVLIHDTDTDGVSGWVVEVEELPGCISQGETPDEAISSVRDAMLGWITVALEDGKPIPEPLPEPEPSGKLLVRIPKTLHAEISRAARREGVSINQFVGMALAGAVRWRSETYT